MSSDDESLILVIRVWREPSGEVLARLTHGGQIGSPSVVVASVPSLVDEIRTVTEEWLRGTAPR